MNQNFLKYRFHFAFMGALAISLVVFCIGGLVYQSKIFSSTYELTPTELFRPIPTNFNPPSPLQIERVVTPTPFLPQIPTPTLTPGIQGWTSLPPIPESSRALNTNGDRSEYKVALTFDVCQSEGDLAGFDTAIIQVLNETKTPATFFLGGLWMRDHQKETIELSNNPLFELGNHSWSHKDFSAITNDEMQKEILLTQQFMYNLVGYQTNLFRLPYGTYTDESLNIINDQGLYIIQWDDVSGDPDPNVNAENMTSWVLQQVQPGSIIIMHANGRGWHTAEALPRIIQSLNEQGYAIVTVSELLKIQPYK